MAGEFVHDTIMDGAFGVVSGATGLALHLTSAAETTRAGVITDSLANISLTGGDFTLANGDTSGRKQTLGAKTGLTVTGSGTATHGCVIDDTNCLTCRPISTPPVFNGTGTADTQASDHEIAAATVT